MNLKNKLKHAYDTNLFYRWMAALAVGCVVFCSPVWIYNLGQNVGPKLGEIIFDFVNEDQLGPMEYYRKP